MATMSWNNNNKKKVFQKVFVRTNKKRIAQTDEEMVTNDKRIFIQLNWSPACYTGTRRHLKAALLSMHSSAYPSPTLEILQEMK